MGWKIPTWGDGIGALVGSVPKIIKYFKDKGRVNEVNKIETSVDDGDDKSVHNILYGVVKKADTRNKANS